jgi:riboflavin transporter
MKRTPYNIVVSGLLISMSIVLTRMFAANFMIVGVQASRLSIGFLPIILAGMICGPWWGLAVGALADALGFLIFPSGVYFPLITLTSALVGLLPALIVRITGRMRDWLKALICVAAVQIICSMLLQTLWLAILFGKAFELLFVPRAIVALATIPIYYILVFSIMAGLKKAGLVPMQQSKAAGA